MQNENLDDNDEGLLRSEFIYSLLSEGVERWRGRNEKFIDSVLDGKSTEFLVYESLLKTRHLKARNKPKLSSLPLLKSNSCQPKTQKLSHRLTFSDAENLYRHVDKHPFVHDVEGESHQSFISRPPLVYRRNMSTITPLAV